MVFMFTIQVLIQKCFEGQPWQPFTISTYLCYLSTKIHTHITWGNAYMSPKGCPTPYLYHIPPHI